MIEFPSWAGLAPDWFGDYDDADFDDELLGDDYDDLPFEYDDDETEPDWYIRD